VSERVSECWASSEREREREREIVCERERESWASAVFCVQAARAEN
jgi:hypothetical protein